MKQLSIAIDYDETFTADMRLWATFIANAKAAGHRVYIVSSRRTTEENFDQINAHLDHWGCQVPIVLCDLRSKLQVTADRGIDIDIWIDDDPRKLVTGH